MKSASGYLSRKDAKISFRTSDSVYSRLKAIARFENTSISSLVENVLINHVVGEKALESGNEKRQAPRKRCSIPTVLFAVRNGVRIYQYGVIASFSLFSMQVVLREKPDELFFESNFFSLFNFSDEVFPITLQCQILRMECIHGEYVLIMKINPEHRKETLEKLKSFCFEGA